MTPPSWCYNVHLHTKSLKLKKVQARVSGAMQIGLRLATRYNVPVNFYSFYFSTKYNSCKSDV